MKTLILLALLGAPPRDPRVREAFIRTHPCPTTCVTYVRTGSKFTRYEQCGACEVDHVCPLACGGADAVENMAWIDKKQNRKKGATCNDCRM